MTLKASRVDGTYLPRRHRCLFMAHRVIFRCDAEFGRSRGISDLPEITACSTRRERAKAGNRVSFGVIHGSSA
jgi:hypothetical protein